jgi:hypothetical protein
MDSLGYSRLESVLKGRHRRNIFLNEKGSLLTAVAKLLSISMIWKLLLELTREKTSWMSLPESVSGTFSFMYGS